jgi:N-acetylmuramoyl-L-alanine amidase
MAQPVKRIVIDPGHGGTSPGAVYHGLQEKNVVLQISLLASDALRLRGYEVVLTRDDDSDVSLMKRCEIANFVRADIFVSVHCNADHDKDLPGMPEANGEEIWIYKGSEGGLRLAQYLQANIDHIFPNEPFRGIKESENLYVLKHTHMPAVLLEIGFIDKSSSSEVFSDIHTLLRIATLITEGIDEYFLNRR